MSNKPLLLCHRGVRRQDENSMSSITEITRISIAKCDLGVEFDVQLTQDGNIVCHHDANPPLSAPKLADVLRKIETTTYASRFINIEIKNYGLSKEHCHLLAHSVHVLIVSYASTTKNHYMISSCSIPILEALVHSNSEKHVDTGFIIYEPEHLSVVSLHIAEYVIIDKHLIRQLQECDITGCKGVLFFTMHNIDGNNDDDQYIYEYLADWQNDSNASHQLGIVTDDFWESQRIISQLQSKDMNT